jgi:polyphosphate kinase
MRKGIISLIDREIVNAKAGKTASIILKVNSLSDVVLVDKLHEAATAGVAVRMIIRGIYSAKKTLKKYEKPIRAISIVDRLLEHARVMVFHQDGNPSVYISSADWMVRNLDHRVEAACPLLDETLKMELVGMLEIQLRDNVKARVLDANFENNYVHLSGKKVRSQDEIYRFLQVKNEVHHSDSGSD